jgi:hypothetical protein
MDSPRPEAEPPLSADLENPEDSHYTPSHHNKSAHISRITWRVLAIHTAITLSYIALITALAYRWVGSERYSKAEPLLYYKISQTVHRQKVNKSATPTPK